MKNTIQIDHPTEGKITFYIVYNPTEDCYRFFDEYSNFCCCLQVSMKSDELEWINQIKLNINDVLFEGKISECSTYNTNSNEKKFKKIPIYNSKDQYAFEYINSEKEDFICAIHKLNK